MRILIVNEARAGGGGVETYLASVVEALGARGHQIALLYGNTAAETGPTEISAPVSWSVRDEGVDRALDGVRRWAPDVCFSHNMRRIDIDRALAAEWPVVKMMHGYFGTCVSGQKAFLFPALEACTRTCGPACLFLYGPRRCGQLRPLEVVRNYRWAAQQRALFTEYRSLVVASRHMEREYIRQGVAADRIHAIPLFAPRTELPRDVGDPIDVLFLGRLTPLKGVRVLADALSVASRVLGRPVSVTIAGEGPERGTLQQRLAAAGVDATFPGWVQRADTAKLFARARVVAIPSIWPEPFGLVGLEAAAHGVPAVAFNVGGIPEWLTDDVNGRLVEPTGGADAFGRAIAAILGDSTIRQRFSEGARAAAARYGTGTHLDRLERVLEAARTP